MVRLYGWYIAAAATCMSLLSSSDAISSAILPVANPEPADGGVASIPPLTVILQPALVANAPTPVGAFGADNASSSGTATAPIPSLVVILKPWPEDQTSTSGGQSSAIPAREAPNLTTLIPPDGSSDEGSDTGSGVGQYEDDTCDGLSSKNRGPPTSPIPTLIVLLKPWPGDQLSASDGNGTLAPATQAPPLPPATPQPTTEKPTPVPTTNKPTLAPTPAQPQHDDPVQLDDSSDDGSDQVSGSGSWLYYDGNDDDKPPTSASTTTPPTPAPTTDKPTTVLTSEKPTTAQTPGHPQHDDSIVSDDSSDDGSGDGSSSEKNDTGGDNEPLSGTERPTSAPALTPTRHHQHDDPVVPDDSSDDASASRGSEPTEEPASKPAAPTIDVATRTPTPAGATRQPDFGKPAASNDSSGDGSALGHDFETPIATSEPATPTPTRTKRTRRPKPPPTKPEQDEDPIFLPIYVEASGSGSDTSPDEPWIVKVPKNPATEAPVEGGDDDEWDDDDADDADDPPQVFIRRRLRGAFH